MPNSASHLQAYWDLAAHFPREWRQIVKMYHSTHDDAQYGWPTHASKRKAASPISCHRCDTCDLHFDSWRSLSTHRWFKHGIKSGWRKYVGDISVCPCCKTDFHTRARLIKHLAERRVRSRHRTQTCQEMLMELRPPIISEDALQLLETCDAEVLASARHRGHTNVLADVPSKKMRLGL